MSDYNRALDIDPSDSDIKMRLSLVHHAFGLDLFNTGAFSQSEIEFTRAITLFDRAPLYYVHRAEAAQYQGHTPQACIDYEKALSLDPHDVSIQNKVQHYRRMKRSSPKVVSNTFVKKQSSATSRPLDDPILRRAALTSLKYQRQHQKVQSLLQDRLCLGDLHYPLPK